MSESQESISNASQLACYCTEFERLASTIKGMLSQCEALGSPLAEDRPTVERLLPLITDLHEAMTSALQSDTVNAAMDTEESEPTPLVRTTGARFVEWHNNGGGESSEGSTSGATTSSTTGSATGSATGSTSELTAGDVDLLSADAGDVERLPLDAGNRGSIDPSTIPADSEAFPSVDRCAELLMSDLSTECVQDMTDKGEVTLQGTNESLPLPSVFQFLGQSSKSGTLRVKTNRETMRFELVQGDLVFSSTDTPPRDQLLGEILIAMGFVTRERLEETLARTGNDKTRLGSVLEDEQLVTLEELRSALKAQIKNRLERAFEAPESAFTFSEGGPDRPHHRIKMSVSQLLLESL